MQELPAQCLLQPLVTDVLVLVLVHLGLTASCVLTPFLSVFTKKSRFQSKSECSFQRAEGEQSLEIVLPLG